MLNIYKSASLIKHFFVFFALFFIALVEVSAQTQVNISLILAPNPPSPRPLEWYNSPNSLSIIIAPKIPTFKATGCKVRAKLTRKSPNEREIFYSKYGDGRPINVGFGKITFSPKELFLSSAFEGLSLNNVNLASAGSLLPGTYEICMEIYDQQNRLIGKSPCVTFTISDVQPPILISPYNDREINESEISSLNFQWSAITPKPSDENSFNYKLEIYELHKGLTDLANIAKGPVEIITTNGMITSAFWQNAAQKLNQFKNIDSSTKVYNYAWRVKAIKSDDEQAIGTGNGYSALGKFKINTGSQFPVIMIPPIVQRRTTPAPVPSRPTNRTPVRQTTPISGRPPVRGGTTPIATVTSSNKNEPILKLPKDNSSIELTNQSEESNEVVFSWGSVTPNEAGVKYTLYVYSQSNGESIAAAIRKKPILTKDIQGNKLNYTWRSIESKSVNLLWRVKATKNGVGVGRKPGENKGFSDVFSLKIKGAPKAVDKEAEPKTPNDRNVVSFKDLQEGYVFEWTPGKTNNNEPGINYEIEITEKRGRGQDTIIKKETNITTNEFKWVFVPKYDAQYTWKIKTKNKSNNLIGVKEGNNKGISEIKTFSIKSEAKEDSIVIVDCDKNVKVIKFNVVNTPGNIDFTGKYIKVNTFNMLVTEISKTSNRSGLYTLSGKGSITVPWLLTPIHVEFENIGVAGSNKTMTSGNIYAIQDIDTRGDFPSFLKASNNSKVTKAQAKKLRDNLFKNKDAKIVSGQSLDNNLLKAGGNDIPKLPLGMNNVLGYTLAITEMSFSALENKLVCIAVLPYAKETAEDVIAFAAADIQFDQSSPSKAGGKLVLLEDFNIVDPAEESYGITLLAKDGKDFSTYIEWDCKGFKNLKVAVDVSLPRKWLIPTIENENIQPDTTAKVKARAIADITNLNDWLLTLKLGSCEIVGLEGSELEIEAIVIDNSDKKNPEGIKFPKEFTGAKDDKFRGFYIQSAKMVLPKFFNKSTDTTGIQIAVDNFIIGKTGLSGSIAVGSKENPIINLASGTLGDFQASLEKVEINILNKSIKKAEVSGRLLLPISQAGTNEANTLAYTASWNDGTKKKGSSVLLEIKPGGEKGLSADLFGGAVLSLDNTSIISMEYTKGKTKKSKGTVISIVNLNGNININKRLLDKIDANLTMTFANLGFTYNNSNPKVKNFTFNKASFGFASPQKKVGGFNATLTKVELTDNPTTPQGYLASVILSFDVNLNLGANFSGTTNLSLIGGIKKENNQYKPGFIDAKINTISVDASVAAVALKGTFTFYSNDPVYGQGFKGEAAAVFEKVGAITAAVQFGSVLSPTTNQNYNYWFAEAKLILKKPIPIVNPIGLKGAGIGAWYHMSTSGTGSVSAEDANKTEDVKGTNSGMEFKPDDKNLFGFRISGVFVTTSSERGFNGDLVFSASFTKSDGIEKLGVTGEGYVGAALNDRDKALVKGTLDASYDFTKDYLNVKVAVSIKYPPVSPLNVYMLKTVGDAEFILTVDGQKKINNEPAWSLTIGTPKKPNQILYYQVFNLWFYMRMGNDLTPTDFNDLTKAGLALVSPTLKPEPVADASSSGKGFDFGFGFNQAGSINFGPFGGSFTVGGEMNLSLMKYDAANGCVTDKMDYWYARGGAAAYANANVNFMGLGFNLGAGALMQGGAPDPLWVKGKVAGRVSVKIFVLTIGFNANVGFTYGTPCRPQKSIAGAGGVGVSNQLELESIDDLDVDGLIEPIDFLYHSSGAVDKLTPIRFVSIFDVSFTKDNTSEHKTFSIDVMEGEVKVTKTYKVLVDWHFKACQNGVYLNGGWSQTSFYSQKYTSGNNTWYEIALSYQDGHPRNLLGHNECYQTQLTATLWELKNNVWVVAKNSKGIEISKRPKEEIFTTHSK